MSLPERDYSPALLYRMKRAIQMKFADPRYECHLGWLNLAGELTEQQLSAGQKFVRIFDSYSRAKGFPPRSPQSPGFELRSPSSDEGEDLDPEVVRKTEKQIRQYERLRDTLQAVGCLADVVSVCVDNNVPTEAEVRRLKRGLDLVTMYFDRAPGRPRKHR